MRRRRRDVLRKYGSDYKCIFVGDARMSPYEIPAPAARMVERQGRRSLAGPCAPAMACHVWIDTCPERCEFLNRSDDPATLWSRMQPMTLGGIGAAMKLSTLSCGGLNCCVLWHDQNDQAAHMDNIMMMRHLWQHNRAALIALPNCCGGAAVLWASEGLYRRRCIVSDPAHRDQARSRVDDAPLCRNLPTPEVFCSSAISRPRAKKRA
jgi:hypothetical protein